MGGMLGGGGGGEAPPTQMQMPTRPAPLPPSQAMQAWINGGATPGSSIMRPQAPAIPAGTPQVPVAPAGMSPAPPNVPPSAMNPQAINFKNLISQLQGGGSGGFNIRDLLMSLAGSRGNMTGIK